MPKLSAAERKCLLQRARQAARRSYSPYSQFKVGAAVLAGGRIYTGTNVENASFGLTLCAERAALSAAVAGGLANIRAVAVACVDAAPDDKSELMPCGACRQWMSELAPHAEVIIDGLPGSFAVADLLPHGFKLRTGSI